MTLSTCFSLVPVAKLTPHPLNAALYGDGADADLVESVRQNGVLSPILATKTNVVISGHRRLNAAMMAGLKSVPVIYTKATDPLEVEELLITANTQRQKSAEQIAREASRLLEIEQERAKKRQGARTDLDNICLNSDECSSPKKGRADAIVAEKLHVGRDTMTKSIKVVAKADELKAAGEGEQATELLDTLNNQSVNAAYKKIKPEQPNGNCSACGGLFEKNHLKKYAGLCVTCHTDREAPAPATQPEEITCPDCLKKILKRQMLHGLCCDCLAERRRAWRIAHPGDSVPDVPPKLEAIPCFNCCNLRESFATIELAGQLTHWCRECYEERRKKLSAAPAPIVGAEPCHGCGQHKRTVETSLVDGKKVNWCHECYEKERKRSITLKLAEIEKDEMEQRGKEDIALCENCEEPFSPADLVNGWCQECRDRDAQDRATFAKLNPTYAPKPAPTPAPAPVDDGKAECRMCGEFHVLTEDGYCDGCDSARDIPIDHGIPSKAVLMLTSFLHQELCDLISSLQGATSTAQGATNALREIGAKAREQQRAIEKKRKEGA